MRLPRQILHSRIEFCCALFICGRDIKLIYRRIIYRTERILNFITKYLFSFKSYKPYWILIVKLEQILIKKKLEQVKNKSYWILYCKTGTNFSIWGQLLDLLKNSYILYIMGSATGRARGALPPNLKT